MAYAGIVPEDCAVGVPDANGVLVKVCGKEQLFELFHNLIGYAEFLAILVAGIAVLYGGFRVLTSGGDEGKVSEGHQAITKAVIGIAIVFGAYLIVNTIITIFLPNCSGAWTIIGGDFDCSL